MLCYLHPAPAYPADWSPGMPHSSPSGQRRAVPRPLIPRAHPDPACSHREPSFAPDSTQGAGEAHGMLMANTTTPGHRNCPLPDSVGSRCWGQAPRSPAHHCCHPLWYLWNAAHCKTRDPNTHKHHLKTPWKPESKGVSKATLNFPALPYPSFREHLGMIDLPWMLDHVRTWEGSSYFQAE